MRRGARLLTAAAALAACRPLPSVPAAPGEAARATHVRVRVDFEPPLPTAGELVVEHESGYRWGGRTGATGVDFDAPEGPCTLTLRFAARVVERTWRVSSQSPALTWRVASR